MRLQITKLFACQPLISRFLGEKLPFRAVSDPFVQVLLICALQFAKIRASDLVGKTRSDDLFFIMLYGRVSYMEIAILGYRRELRNELEAQLRICLGENARYTPKQYGMDEPVYNRDPPEDTAAAFIIIDDARALHVAGAVANWGKNFPIAFAATGPQYALEGIRLRVKHYILYPLEQKDIRETLIRMGVTI